jgi:hypothetical protein
MIIPQTDPSYPTPPKGYRAVVPFEYPKMKLQWVSLAVLVTTPVGLIALMAFAQTSVVSIRLDRVGDMVTMLLTALAVTMAHELLHGLAYRVLGYRVTYGFSLHPIAAYVAAFGQWHTRGRSVITALVPLVVLTAACAPLLTLSNPMVVLVGLTALTLNTSAVVGDLYLVWCVLRMPRGTLFYPIDLETMLVYVPLKHT